MQKAEELKDKPKKRIFIGIDIPVGIKNSLQKLQKGLPLEKLTHPGNFHITLRFMGYLTDEQVKEAEKLLEKVNFEPFSVMVKGIGYFNVGRGLIFAGIEDKEERLNKLYHEQSEIINQNGLAMADEKLPYTPHLTLGCKVTEKSAMDGLLLKNRGLVVGRFVINRIHLYESRGNGKDKEYIILKSFPNR